MGIIREYEVLTDNVLIQTSNENTQYPPWGLNGGSESGASKFVFWPNTEKEETFVTERVSDYGPFNTGDKLSFQTTGGGGWGDPKDRPREMIEDDLRNGLISLEEAKAKYGYEA